MIEYLKTPPSRARLVEMINAIGTPVRDVLRRKGTPYDALGIDDPNVSVDRLIDLMLEHPMLFDRPIVETPLGPKLCRSSEGVLDIPPYPQRGAFTKEDGEPVVDASGQRIAATSGAQR